MSNSNNDSAIESIEHELYDSKSRAEEVKIHGAKRHKELNLPTSWGEDSSIITRARDDGGMSFGAKLLLISTFLLIAAVAFSAWKILASKNSISANNIEMTIDVAPLIQGGDSTPLVVTLHNSNTVNLESSRVTLLYKRGNGSQDEQEKVQEKRDIGTIKPNEFKKQDFSIMLYGGESEIRSINLKLEYKVAGSNAVFSKIVSADVVLKSPSVSVSIEGPDKLSVGQSGTFSFVIKNTSATSSLASVLQIVFPNSFAIESSTPKPLARSTSWQIESIPSMGSKTIEIVGSFNGKQGEMGTFQAKVGSQGNNQTIIGVVYSAKTKDITLQASPLTVGLNLSTGVGNGEVLRYGEKAVITLSYDNGSSQALEDVSLKLTLSGDAALYGSVDPSNGIYDLDKKTITWNKDNFQDLAVLAPNTHGVLQVTVPVVQRGATTPVVRGVFEGSAKVAGSQDIVASASKVWNVVGSATLDASSQYKTSSFQNNGPVPPEPKKETTYTALLKVTAQSALSSVRVSFVLPAYVTWRGVTSNMPGITYDSKSRTVSWNIGSMEQGRIAVAEIGLSLRPSVSHVGQTPALTSGIILDADEDITRVHLKTTLSPLTISVRNEDWSENPAVVVNR